MKEKGNNKRKGTTGYAKLYFGEVPKPARVLGCVRHIDQLHKEIMAAKNMTSVISLKDVRTVRSYYIALARLKLSQLDLAEMIEKLQIALHGKE